MKNNIVGWTEKELIRAFASLTWNDIVQRRHIISLQKDMQNVSDDMEEIHKVIMHLFKEVQKLKKQYKKR